MREQRVDELRGHRCTATESRRTIRRMARRIGNFSLAIAPMLWEGRGIGAIYVVRASRRGLYRQGDRAAEDLRRPGRDRDPERALFKRGAGGARRRRGRQRRQELVPRDHEPRDPHADERGDRHERAAARHAAERRAARLRRDHPRLGRCAADDHQRHPRLLEDRGRADGHRVASRSTCATASSRRSTSSARARPRSTSTSPTCSRATCRRRSAPT